MRLTQNSQNFVQTETVHLPDCLDATGKIGDGILVPWQGQTHPSIPRSEPVQRAQIMLKAGE